MRAFAFLQPNTRDLRLPRLLAEAFCWSAVGIVGGLLVFPEVASLAGVFLMAFAVAPAVDALLERNKEEVWAPGGDPGRANRRLAAALFAVFCGVLTAFATMVWLSPAEKLDAWFDLQLGPFVAGHVTEVDFGTFPALLSINVRVLTVCLLFALAYRHGGLLLVLAWNASRWGVIFSYVARKGASDEGAVAGLGVLLRTAAGVLPHLALEALAYILAAMCGVFLSKALAKYEITSSAFAQVGMAVLRLLGIALLLLSAGAAVEAWLAPELIGWLFGS